VAASGCFHCGDPLTGTEPWFVEIDAERHRVCCPGCKAVAELIRESGLSDYYRFRTLPTGRPGDSAAVEAPDLPWKPFDRPEMLDAVSTPEGDGLRTCTMLVEGVRCAACGWLIERSLEQVPGVREIRVNPSSSRARLVWDPASCRSVARSASCRASGIAPTPAAPARPRPPSASSARRCGEWASRASA
jgi:Cu2+-exporting ATPase